MTKKINLNNQNKDDLYAQAIMSDNVVYTEKRTIRGITHYIFAKPEQYRDLPLLFVYYAVPDKKVPSRFEYNGWVFAVGESDDESYWFVKLHPLQLSCTTSEGRIKHTYRSDEQLVSAVLSCLKNECGSNPRKCINYNKKIKFSEIIRQIHHPRGK